MFPCQAFVFWPVDANWRDRSFLATKISLKFLIAVTTYQMSPAFVIGFSTNHCCLTASVLFSSRGRVTEFNFELRCISCQSTKLFSLNFFTPFVPSNGGFKRSHKSEATINP